MVPKRDSVGHSGHLPGAVLPDVGVVVVHMLVIQGGIHALMNGIPVGVQQASPSVEKAGQLLLFLTQDVADDLGLAGIAGVAVPVGDAAQDGSGIALALVGDGSTVFGHLQRGKGAGAPACSGFQGIPDPPFPALVFSRLEAGYLANVLGQLDASGLTQTQAFGIKGELVDAQIIAQGIEIIIAGIPQGGGHILIPVGEAACGPDPAGGGIAIGFIPIKHPLTANLILGGDDV